MHNNFGPFGLLMIVLYVVVLCIPIGKILARIGFSGWWSLLAVVPVVNLIAIWIFAFSDWPQLAKRVK